MTETITIPLNKLLAWEGNVRQTEPDKNIDELAASIASHGLLQSLVVRKDKRGKYAVIAGQRRLLALQSLAEGGRIEDARPIPCAVIDADADAEEISLAENVQREAMHPADEFDAFKALVDKGTPVADIAARFGVTESVVQKRLKLAKVSPVLIAAYRAGEMTLQHVMAFTVTDDHAMQERVWKEMPEWQKEDPDVIYDLLTEDEVTAKDRRVKFVGLEAYERAGGTVRRDLFSDTEDGVFIEDAVLLESLVAAKLESAADEIRKAGWKWIEIRSTFDHDEWSKYGRVQPTFLSLSPEQQTELDHLQAEHEALWEIEENTETEEERIAELAARIHELEDRERVWSPETLSNAGVIITLGFDGEADIHEGYVRPEDRREAAKAVHENHTPKPKPGGLSVSLIESLTAHRSAALNAELCRRPDVALAALVSSLVDQIFAYDLRENSALQITAFCQMPHRVEGSPAHAVIEEEYGKWAARLPNRPELFQWCMDQEQKELLRFLAFCVAQSVDAVRTKTPHSEERIEFTEALVSAVQLDMEKWFRPTAENYFGKISKAQILDALREANGSTAPAWADMKKADLAALAERQIANTGWLPEPLRAASKSAD
jgi:ParB family chromosome partitioning protein